MELSAVGEGFDESKAGSHAGYKLALPQLDLVPGDEVYLGRWGMARPVHRLIDGVISMR